MIRLYNILFLLALLVASSMGSDFRDFSGVGPEHKILSGLRLDALNVDFVEKRRIDVDGSSLEASVFFVRTSQTVPFLAGINPYNNVMKDIFGFYDLIVAEDASLAVHDRLVESMFHTLSSKEKGDFGFVRGQSSYLLFAGPAKSPDTVWVGGRVIKASLRRFTEKRSDINNNAESFWKEKIRFEMDGVKYRIESPKKNSRDEFLRLHQEGLFSRKKGT